MAIIRTRVGFALLFVRAIAPVLPAVAPTEGRAAFEKFLEWKRSVAAKRGTRFRRRADRYGQYLISQNAVYLATRGWDVTGFDAAEVGIQKAKAQAAAANVTITAVHASDEEFDFGRERWDLIAIIYAVEKRSVHRVRDAVKPGCRRLPEGAKATDADPSLLLNSPRRRACGRRPARTRAPPVNVAAEAEGGS